MCDCDFDPPGWGRIGKRAAVKAVPDAHCFL